MTRAGAFLLLVLAPCAPPRAPPDAAPRSPCRLAAFFLCRDFDTEARRAPRCVRGADGGRPHLVCDRAEGVPVQLVPAPLALPSVR